ncbi:MAG: hypothetical protein KF729_09330 [Sandaracinaceae bacterium]|nr:hypothetical protein [Sandaracinaceae bacterium]
MVASMLCAGCGGGETVDGGGAGDAAPMHLDGGPSAFDAGARDAGTMSDAGAADASTTDASATDAAAADAGDLDAATADAGLTAEAVRPLYPSAGEAFMTCVVADGADELGASGAPCDLTDTSSVAGCFHAGALRAIELTGMVSCAGVTISDALGAFDWTCEDDAGVARAISTGFADGKGLGDLLEADGSAFRMNSVTASGAGSFTSASTRWWNDAIVIDDDGGLNTTSDRIYVATEAANATYEFRDIARAAFVIMPGVALRGGGASEYVVSGLRPRCAWFEGAIDATGHLDGLVSGGAYVTTVHEVTVTNATNEGVQLTTWRHGRAQHVTVRDNGRIGLELQGDYLRAVDVEATNNGGDAVFLRSGRHGVLEDLRLTGGSLVLATTASSVEDVTVRHVELVGGGIRLGRVNGGRIMHVDIRDYPFSGSVPVIRHDAQAPGTTFYDVHVTNSGNLRTGTGQVWVGLTQDEPNEPGGSAALWADGYSAVLGYVSRGARGRGVQPGGFTTMTHGVAVDSERDATLPFSSTTTAFYVEQPDNLLHHVVATQYPHRAFYFLHGATLSGVLRVDDAMSDCAWSTIPGAAVTDANCVPVASGGATVEYGASAGGLLGPPEFALATGDTILRGRATVPTGDDVLTHRFPDQTTAEACTRWGGTSFDATTRRCTAQLLRDAYERFDDGVGNDNGLCESGEDCVWMPNIGAYQGHGDLVLETTIGSGGALSDIRLHRFATNGR